MIDVLVVGAGPAGLAAAIEARLRGLSVVVADPRDGPIDKACGEGLMPAAVRHLAALGVDPPGVPFDGVRYLQGSHRAEGTFASGPGRGVRRTALSEALDARALALGVERVSTRIGDVTSAGDRVRTDAGLEARFAVVADGLASPLRRKLGLDAPTRWPRRLGLRRHFATRPWTDKVEVYWSPRCEAYVTPVAADTVGVALLFAEAVQPTGSSASRFAALLADLPELAERLGDPVSTVRGSGPFARTARARVADRVLLVGDAAGYLDPLTGEGVRLGLDTARAAIDAIACERPATYEAAWRRVTRTYFRATGALVWLAGSPLARRLVVPTCARVPGLMSRAVRLLGD